MKRYLCIGGPLNGERANRKDFDEKFIWRGQVTVPEGNFVAYKDEYHPYNSANGFPPSMIWIHRSLLVP